MFTDLCKWSPIASAKIKSAKIREIGLNLCSKKKKLLIVKTAVPHR